MRLKRPDRQMKRHLLCLLLLITFSIPGYGQTQDQDAFASVPEVLRARLRERLKLLVEYQSTQQWEKQYLLLSTAVTQSQTKDDYVRRNRYWYTKVVPEDLIVDFEAKATTTHELSPEAGWWTIYGCAKLRRKGLIEKLYASVDAHREGGDWYFSTVGVIAPIDGQPQLCPYGDTSTHRSRCSAKGFGKN